MPTSSIAASIPSIAASEILSVSASDELTCMRCDFATTLVTSQSYGRNPFHRTCNDCNGAYRGRAKVIKQEKSLSATGFSEQEQAWKKMSGEEQKQWYRKYHRKATQTVVDARKR